MEHSESNFQENPTFDLKTNQFCTPSRTDSFESNLFLLKRL